MLKGDVAGGISLFDSEYDPNDLVKLGGWGGGSDSALLFR